MSLVGLLYVIVPLVVGEFVGRSLRVGAGNDGLLRLGFVSVAIVLFAAVPGGAPTTASTSMTIGFVAGVAEGVAGPSHAWRWLGRARTLMSFTAPPCRDG